jgi:hypothetical protein
MLIFLSSLQVRRGGVTGEGEESGRHRQLVEERIRPPVSCHSDHACQGEGSRDKKEDLQDRECWKLIPADPQEQRLW